MELFRAWHVCGHLKRLAFAPLMIGSVLGLTSCGSLSGSMVPLGFDSGGSSESVVLSGVVEPIASGLASKPTASSARGAAKGGVQAFSCASPTASLYLLNSSGTKILPAKSTVSVDSSGKYEFKDLKSLGIEVSGTSLVSNVFVEVDGCSQSFARVATGLDNQNIHYGTSLIAWISQTSASSSLALAPKSKLAQLMELLRTESSQTAAYSTLSSNSTLSSLFSDAFGVAPTVLADAAPTIDTANVPSTANEQSPVSLGVSAHHWSNSYSLAYEWKLDSALLSTSQNTTWTPSANSQGLRSITLFVGKNDGTGHVDTTKPYTSKSYSLQVANTVPASPPALAIVGPSNVNSPSITLRISTGALIDGVPANCATFSALALVESDNTSPVTTPPTASASYNIDCTTANSQTLSYTLTTGEGTKTLRLWARDSAGNISATPSTMSLRYSTAGPVITFSSPAAGSYANGPMTITGACDSNASDVTVTGDIVGSPVTANCSGGTFSKNITLSSGDGSKGVSVEQQDSYGNIGSATRSFMLDTVAPTVLLASSATHPTHTSPIPVTITFSESVSGFDSSDLTLSNATVASFSGSGTTYSITLTPSGQGTVSVSVPAGAAKDAAGNDSGASATLSRTFDSVQPTVTIARASGQAALTNALPIQFTISFSEPLQPGTLTVSDFSVSGTAAAGANWSLSTSDNQTFTLSVTSASTNSGTFIVDLNSGKATDAAGNPNASAGASATVTYDAAAPSFTGLAVSPASPGANKRPSLSGTTETSSSVSLHTGADCSGPSLASTTANASTGTFTLTPSSDIGTDGTYTLRAKAADPAGNSTCSSAVTYVLDTAKPSITLARASGQSALTKTLPIAFSLTFSEPINPATFDLSKITKGGTASGVVWSLTTANNTVYTLSATAVTGAGTLDVSLGADQAADLAGNQNTASSGSISVEYDNVLPSFSSLAVTPASPGTNPKPTLSGTTEASSTITLHLAAGCGDGALASGTAAGDGSFSLTSGSNLSSDGAYNIYVKAVDPAGNSACSTATSYVLDRATHAITINSAGLGSSPSNSTAPRSVTLSGTDVASYKAVVITSGSCSSADFSSASETPLATGFTFTPTANASNTVCAIGKSTAGVWEVAANASSSSALIIDTNAPTFSGLAVAPAALHNTRRPTLSGTTESNAAIELHAASGCGDASLGSTSAAGNGSFSLQPTANLSSDGSFAFYLKATDAAGNSTCSSSSVAYQLDTQAPTLTFTAPAASSYANAASTANLTVSGTCSEDATVAVVASDGSLSATTAAVACTSGTFTSSLNLSTLAEGAITLTLSGSDAATNSATSVSRSITKDTQAPTATLSGSPTSPSNATSLNVSVAGSGVTHFKYKVGVSGSTDCTSGSGYGAETAEESAITDSISGLADGSLKLCVVGRDAAGNYQPYASATTYTWTKDTGAPTLTITAPIASSYINSSSVTSVSVTGTCSESGRTVTLSAAGGATVSDSATCSGGNTFSVTMNFSSLNEGAVAITADLSDAAGNSAPQASVSVTKDTVAPSFTLGSLPASLSNATSLNVSVTSADATHYQYKVGSAGSVTCSSATGYSADIAKATNITDALGSDGSYKLCVTAKDAAGNSTVLASATSHTWTKDTVVADFSSMASNPVSPSQNPKPAITGVTEPSAVVALYSQPSCLGSSIADGTANGTTGAFSLTPSSDLGTDGTYNLSVLATDAAGNTRCLATSLSYVLDRQAPVLTVTTPATNPSDVKGTTTIAGSCENGLSVSFSGSGVQSGSPVTCSGGSFTQNVTLTSGESSKTVVVSSVDGAGNTTNVNLTLNRDDTAPVLAFSSPAAGAYNATGLTITGTCEAGLTVNISGAGVDASSTTTCAAGSPGTFSKAITFSAVDGNKVVTVAQTDAAGNTGSVSRTFERYTPPAVNFSVAAQEVAESQGSATVTLTLPAAATKTVTVPITTSGTATLNTDYTLSASSVVFSVGDSSKILTVNLIDDTTSDDAETIILGLGTITDGVAGTTIATQTLTLREPSLDLNFASLANDGNPLAAAPYNTIAFSRNSTGTFFDADGRMKTAKAHVPRFDHNPVTGQPRGLLIEEQRTNVQLNSERIDLSPWAKVNVSISANLTTAPDGTLTADKVVETATSADHNLDHNSGIGITSGNAYTLSVYAKAAERSWIRLQGGYSGLTGKWAFFDIANGAIGATSGGLLGQSIENVGNGWYRCSISMQAGNSSGSLSVYLATGNNGFSYQGDGTSGLYIWGAQFEDGPFPTSYIPTTGASATRLADVASITPISSWFNDSSGSILVDFIKPFSIASYPRLVHFSDGTSANMITSYAYGSGVSFQLNAGNSTQAAPFAGGFTLGSKAKAAFGYAANNFYATINAGAGGSLASGTAATGSNQLIIGSLGSNNSVLNGTVSHVAYFKSRLDNSSLKSLSNTATNFRSITPTAQFTLSSQSVLESTSNAYVTVMLSEPSTSTVSVPYTVGTGSPNAVSGTDYSGFSSSGNFSFAAGETRKTLSLTIANRAGDQGARDLVINLGAPTGATLGSRASQTIKIIDTSSGFTIASSSQTNTNNTVTYTGTCDPSLGNIVVSGQESATVTCQNDGTWTWTSSAPGADGSYSYTFTQTDAITSIVQTGTWTRDTQVTPFSGLAVAPASPGIDPTPTLTGSTEANASVELYKNSDCSTGGFIAKSTANGSGSFTLTPGYSVGPADAYNFYVKAIDALGNTRCSSAVAYTLVAPTLDLKLYSKNLVTYSEQIDKWSWFDNIEAFGSGSVANSTAAPDGTTTAELLKETTGSGPHRFNLSLTGTVGYRTLSVYAKAGTRSRISVRLYEASVSNSATIADLSTGTVIGGPGSIQAAGNGWYRISHTYQFTSASNGKSMSIEMVDGSGSASYTGTGATIYIWGVQFEEGSVATDYEKTDSSLTPIMSPLVKFSRPSGSSISPGTYFDSSGTLRMAKANLIYYSESFDTTGTGLNIWSLINATVAANSLTAPDGSLTADLLSEQAVTGEHYVDQVIGLSTNLTYTFSIYVKNKAGSARNLDLVLYDHAAPENYVRAIFNPSTGAYVGGGAAGSASLTGTSSTDMGNGWYRVSMTASPSSNSNTAIIARYRIVDGVTISVAGDTNAGLYLWGAQLEERTALSSYVATTTANNYLPRFDFDPMTKASKGLLVEESRMNKLLYSDQFDNAAYVMNQASVSANATTAPDGTSNADKLVENTNTDVHSTSQGASLSSGASATISVFAKAAGRTKFRLVLYSVNGSALGAYSEVDLGAGTISSPAAFGPGTVTLEGSSIVPIGNGWYRVSISATPSGNTAYNFQIELLDGSGNRTYTGDGTSGIYFWGAQLEQGTVPTSYIPTTTTAMTRNSDAISVPTGNGTWFNAAKGTLFTQFNSPFATGSSASYHQYLFDLDDGSGNNQIGLRIGNNPYTTLYSPIANGASLQSSLTTGTNYAMNQNARAMVAWAANDHALTVNGATPVSSTSATVPASTTLYIGNLQGTFYFLDGWIQTFQYYNTRLSNATLQSASAP